jgi:transcription antitermination protein NusB
VGKRRAGRESALRILYELEFNESGAESVLAREAADAYVAWLVRGAIARRDEIDALIESISAHWRVARMALVDRNILRLAVFEMTEDAVLAPAIVINEAIEIARRFSGDEAAVFVNGVLDAVRRKLGGAKAEIKATTEKKETQDNGRTQDAPQRGTGPRGRPRAKK